MKKLYLKKDNKELNLYDLLLHIFFTVSVTPFTPTIQRYSIANLPCIMAAPFLRRSVSSDVYVVSDEWAGLDSNQRCF